MRRVIPIIVAAGIVVAGIGILASRQDALTPMRYFPETGYVVREPFLSFFEEHGGRAMFGFPLSDAYTTDDGVLVQTFQRAQMQLTVRGVELTPLGRLLHLGDEGEGFTVALPFREFYEAHGGASFFGPPLGQAREENGVLLQDFERSRLVRDALGEVRMYELGSVYLAAFPPTETGIQANIRLRGTPLPPSGVRASVSVGKPTVSQNETQTIYLYVEDVNGNPIAGAQALAVLSYNGVTAEVVMPDTDERGLASASFVAPPAVPGSRVIVEMHVLAGEAFLTVETAYFQWW
jgi:hypothetical protein